jgi:hypothetical protein
MKQLINFYTNGLLREDMPFVSIERIGLISTRLLRNLPIVLSFAMEQMPEGSHIYNLGGSVNPIRDLAPRVVRWR